MPGNVSCSAVRRAIALWRSLLCGRGSSLTPGSPTPAALVGIVLASAAALSGACGSAGGEKPAVETQYSKSTGRLERLIYDTNRDGKPDAWTHMDGTRLLRMEIDRNFDGVVDRWEYYADDGSIEKVGFSRANDGIVDAWAFQGTKGEIVRIEISTRRDGIVSRWELYEGGVLARAEEDSDGDNRVDKWETYRDGALTSTALDTRRTGSPDRRLIYGPDGVRVEKIGKN